MTREEAVKVIENRDSIMDYCENAQLGEALEMAIKALEQEPRKITLEDVKGYCKPRCLTIITNELLYELTHSKIKTLEQEPCEDCISRQTVLDMAEDMTDQFGNKHRVVTEGLISMLPSVTPKENVAEWVFLDECANSGYYCSKCHKKLVKEGWSNTVKKIKFCTNCGAKMSENPTGSEYESDRKGTE